MTGDEVKMTADEWGEAIENGDYPEKILEFAEKEEREEEEIE